MHKKLKVLVPVDIGNYRESNPYVVEMIKSLDRNEEIDSVLHGTFWFEQEHTDYDIIHFQWPEKLISDSTLNFIDIGKLHSKINQLKKNARIVSTVHNLYPHYREDAELINLYKLIYKKTDAFVHFGSNSIKLLKIKYPEETEGKRHVIIPHGNYKCFGEPPGKQEARAYLKLPEEGIIVTVFGQLRSTEEYHMAEIAIKQWDKDKKILLVCGRLPLRLPNIVLGRLGIHIVGGIRSAYFFIKSKMNKNIILHEMNVPSKLVKYYCAASDIFLIPRPNILNSGNLYLGFTYGRVVVGPDVGNVGEILRKHNNPVFDPLDLSSIPKALNQAYNLMQKDVGESNRKIAFKDWDWDLISQEYVGLYRSLLSEP